MSGVPTTEKCLLPRVVMRCPLLRVREGFPYAVERRGEAASVEVDAEDLAVQSLDERRRSGGATVPFRRSLDLAGHRRYPGQDELSGLAGKSSVPCLNQPECLPIVTLARACARHCGGWGEQCRAISQM
ncbi:hypothetical protein PUN28_018398 [Cardiocondyla obscurior]|uniref:Uncharacterized protein n=1 Tax=Cardiocondyla obscurior TaxID=286306 RepID=A0AAW2ELV3_9HYME